MEETRKKRAEYWTTPPKLLEISKSLPNEPPFSVGDMQFASQIKQSVDSATSHGREAIYRQFMNTLSKNYNRRDSRRVCPRVRRYRTTGHEENEIPLIPLIRVVPASIPEGSITVVTANDV